MFGRLIIFGIVASGLASAGLAQQGRDGGKTSSYRQSALDASFRRAAACINRDSPSAARQLLATPLGSDEEAKRVRTLLGSSRNCFGSAKPVFNATMFRGMVAEFAYLERFRLNDPERVRGRPLPLPDSFAVHADDGSGRPEQRVAWQLGALARCAVFVDPAGSRRLVLGPRNVADEDVRFAAMMPAIRKCTSGQTASMLHALEFRGFIADALLNRALAG